jgi:hypothetical protein
VPEADHHLSPAQRRRAWALAHHPDRGGDPETFVAGLAALDDGRPLGSDDGPVVYRRRRGLSGWLGIGRPRPPTRTLR